MPAPDPPDGSDAAEMTQPDPIDLDFGHIDEDQDPDTIAREVEAVYERHGL